MLFRAGNWMIMTSLVGAGGTLVYATTEAIAAISQVLKDPTLTDAERSNQVLSIIAGAIANNMMFVFSTRAMLRSGLKASDFFKQKIPAKGAGPIEMTEGARIDLEVALRNRGVKPEALQADVARGAHRRLLRSHRDASGAGENSGAVEDTAGWQDAAGCRSRQADDAARSAKRLPVGEEWRQAHGGEEERDGGPAARL